MVIHQRFTTTANFYYNHNEGTVAGSLVIYTIQNRSVNVFAVLDFVGEFILEFLFVIAGPLEVVVDQVAFKQFRVGKFNTINSRSLVGSVARAKLLGVSCQSPVVPEFRIIKVLGTFEDRDTGNFITGTFLREGQNARCTLVINEFHSIV